MTMFVIFIIVIVLFFCILWDGYVLIIVLTFIFWFYFLLNRMDPLHSCSLLRMATKRWLKYYCLLEQMYISKTMFVIFIIVIVLFFCILWDGNVLIIALTFIFWFYFLLNRMKRLPSCTLLKMATKRWLKYYCRLEQMFISKTMFVIFIIVIVLFFCILRNENGNCSDFLFWFYFLLNRLDSLPSCWLLSEATKRSLKCYCLLEQMLVSDARFVIFKMRRGSLFYSNFHVLVLFSFNRREALPSRPLLVMAIERSLTSYCLLEQMLISKTRFEIFIIVLKGFFIFFYFVG